VLSEDYLVLVFLIFRHHFEDELLFVHHPLHELLKKILLDYFRLASQVHLFWLQEDFYCLVCRDSHSHAQGAFTAYLKKSKLNIENIAVLLSKLLNVKTN
jgi:hypothetical protein